MTSNTIAIVSLGVAFLSGLVAFWSAKSASKANKKAEEANDISRHANSISQEALELQQRHAPAPWSELQRAEDTYHISNTSGKDAVITGISVLPVEVQQLLYGDNLPTAVSYGDGYEFRILGVLQMSASSVKITWHYADEPSIELHVDRNL